MAHRFGELLLARYGNYHLDPVPMVFILLSDANYTEGINSNYITKKEATYLRKLMSLYPDNANNRVYYQLKSEASAILRAYRRYHTNLLFNIRKWKVKELNAKTMPKRGEAIV
jgi:hypothetical protein